MSLSRALHSGPKSQRDMVDILIRFRLFHHAFTADICKTDSLVVLSWLTIPHETFKQYVSNHVHQIHSILPDCHWRYVSTLDNPADCASRGMMPSELPKFMLYWLGSKFIRDHPNEWGEG